ncbi:NAD(+)/NADH kinase [Candidatus Woesearchaeota archaeon]|nr:NAD(+)/NADH kinase [Candidatus Woesearchaeota archaeon]
MKQRVAKRVAIVGKFSREFNECRAAVKKSGNFQIVSSRPAVVISFGGDGTLLKAEAKYPQIPKLTVRKAHEYGAQKTCQLSQVLSSLAHDEYYDVPYSKLTCTVYHKGKIIATAEALNEITIRNKFLGCALRYRLAVKEKAPDARGKAHEIIGDGVVIATPFGSSGYYSSIARRTFKHGIGIAHNNPSKRIPPYVAHETSQMRVNILREEGQLCADNQRRVVKVVAGDTITIAAAKRQALVLQKTKKRSHDALFWYV